MKTMVRVYGLLLDGSSVLVSEEWFADTYMTKFPGGGLEPGEGPADTVLREWTEETGTVAKISGHFYTTDFYQPSAFHEDTQIISIYYLLELDEGTLDLTDWTNEELMSGKIRLRWLEVDEGLPDQLTWPIDKHVAKLLIPLQ